MTEQCVADSRMENIGQSIYLTSAPVVSCWAQPSISQYYLTFDEGGMVGKRIEMPSPSAAYTLWPEGTDEMKIWELMGVEDLAKFLDSIEG
jgi:hypothetical protein